MEDNKMTKEDYNNEPVYYCSSCLSLNIRLMDNDRKKEYCDECGCTEIKTSHIDDWSELYEKKYGKKFINLKK